MKNIKMVIAYDGGNYNGWQLQKTGATIQGVLEAALGKKPEPADQGDRLGADRCGVACA